MGRWVGSRLATRAGFAAAAIVATVFLGAGLFALAGFNPMEAGWAIARGSIGSGPALSVTLTRTVPLAITGLAVALAFRAGVWNIGAEGQLYAGGVAAVWVGLTLGETVSAHPNSAVLAIGLALAAAAVAGAVWALLPAFLQARKGANEVVTTILLNFVAIHLVSLLVSGPLQESRGIFQQTDELEAVLRLPALVPDTRVHLGVLVVLALAAGMWGFLRWTRLGFRVRAVGAAPNVAASAGLIRVERIRAGAFLASGAVAGIAGGVEVMGVTYALYSGFSPGWGYSAIAVALLGGLRPPAVLGAALLFGALEAGGAAMQREAGVPSTWVSVVVALVILVAVSSGPVRKRFSARGLRHGLGETPEARRVGVPNG